MQNFPSKLLEDAVYQFSKLPGIGKKTAMRLVLHLLKQDALYGIALGNSIIKICENVKYCSICHNISENDICDICSNPQRDHSTVCVVEDIRDFIAIESTGLYNGVYHILGGVISPMDGVNPMDLNIESLINKVSQGGITEIILALQTTMEGDTTNFYIYKRLKEFTIKLTTIARGVAVGDELQYTDEITLGKSLINRTPYENSLSSN